MRQINIAIIALMLFSGVCLAQSDPQKAVADIAKKTANSLAMFHATLDEETGPRAIEGQAICIAKDDKQQGILITLAIDVRIQPQQIKDLQLVLPGAQQKTIKAELLGTVEGSIGIITFVRALEPFDWTVVKFAPSSDLAVGQMVVSTGLFAPDAANSQYQGLAYISTKIRVPGDLCYVTGGSLTNTCSPVFAADGRAVGLTVREPFIEYQMGGVAPRPIAVALQNRLGSLFFTPCEEFAYLLETIPSDGKFIRSSWFGAVQMNPVVNVGDVKSGMSLDFIVPKSPADKAGLKNNDIITAINGKPIEQFASPGLTKENFVQLFARMKPSQKATVQYVRDGKSGSADVVVEPVPLRPEEAKRYANTALGLIVREKADIEQYNSQDPNAKTDGLPVLLVADRSPAAAAGLKAGDLITTVNAQAIKTVDGLKTVLETALSKTPTKTVNMLILRGGQEQALTIQPAAATTAP